MFTSIKPMDNETIFANPLVVGNPSDIPDGLIGSRFVYYDPETYKRMFGGSVTKPESMPLSAPIGKAAAKVIGKAEPKESTWVDTDIFGRKSPSQKAIGVSAAGQAASEMIGGIQQANVAQYENDITYWTNQGKWWFDKNADFAPSYEEYAPDMPSAEKAVGGAGGAIGLGALKGAATGASVGTMIAPGVGTAVGAGVGVLVGAIEGIFTLGAAKEADKTNARNALNEYKRQLKEWTYAMNARLTEKRNISEAGQKEFISQAGQVSISRKQEKATRAELKRQAILQSIIGAGSVKQSERQKSMARWS